MLQRSFFAAVFFIFASLFPTQAETLLEDDFEGGKLNETKWDAKAEWKIIKPEAKVDKLGKGVVDIDGGQANFSKKTDFNSQSYRDDVTGEDCLQSI